MPTDKPALLAVLNVDSPVEMLLRGHLFVEQQLTEVLREALPNPDALDFTRLNFPTLVSLGSSLGLPNLAAEDVPALLKLNTLRNRLAHRLDWNLDAEAEREF